MIDKYSGGFKIEVKEKKKVQFDLKKAVPIDLIIKVRDKGTKDLYTYCDRCGVPRSHLRIHEAIQCIKCGYTKKIRT